MNRVHVIINEILADPGRFWFYLRKTSGMVIPFFTKVLRKVFLFLLSPISLIFPTTLRIYGRNIILFASGRYALEMRKAMHTQLSSMKRKTSLVPLNVFHGLYSTVQPALLKQGLNTFGVKSRIETIDYNPGYQAPDMVRSDIVHPDFYFEHIKFDLDIENIWENSISPRPMLITDDYNLLHLYQYFIENWPKYDVFHFNWFLSFLPDNIDVEFIRKSGRKVYFHFRGCFILAKIAPEFGSRGQSAADACAHCKLMGWREQYFARFHRAIKFADRVFVSTPNLCHCSPDFEYMPLSLDPDLAKIPPPLPDKYRTDKTIVILHAPSGGPIKRYEKGTDLVIAAVDKLQDEGFNISLKFIENMSRAEAIKLYGSGDIFIEQLHLGSYGNTAIEAMAYGLPVLSCNPASHTHLTPNCPVVDVNPMNLVSVLRDFVVSAEKREEVGRKCYEYVHEFHGSEIVSEHLLSIYQEDLGLKGSRNANTLSNLNPDFSPANVATSNQYLGGRL
ncbi:MAG: glycosyltransferase [Anaerolineales bacterium]|nr:glycosyltransferase [Anaerolineales bacterium]